MTTVTIGSRTANTFTGFKDTYLAESAPASAQETFNNITVAVGSGTRSHCVLRVPGLAANITGPVTGVSSGITLKTNGAGTSVNVALYKLAVNYVDLEVTWQRRNATGPTLWTTAGAFGATDLVSLTPIATGTVPAADATEFTVSGAGLTADFEAIINGTSNDYGYLLCCDPDDSGTITRTFRSTETGTESNRPYATFEYTAGAPGPTVTSVTQTSGGTEGSPAVMTVALSGATSGSTNFAATLAGVTATGSGTDFTSDLASATYSNGVTFSGGNMVVPDAVSGWTVTISTTSDTLDEANETATLTVGGTAGTLTITDDDAAPTITGTASQTVTAGSPVVITYSPGLSGQSRTYTLALTDGTAVGGTDYDNTTVTGDFAVTAGTGSVSISGSTVTVDAGVTEFTLSIGTTA